MLETGEKRPRSGGVLTYQEIYMQTYVHKAALITEIELQAKRFCDEFQTIAEADKDLLLESVERTPAQMLAYQIGWMQLIWQWEAANRQGKSVITPHPDYKWNQLGGLYQYFYRTYAQQSLSALQKQFTENVTAIVALIDARTGRRNFVYTGQTAMGIFYTRELASMEMAAYQYRRAI